MNNKIYLTPNYLKAQYSNDGLYNTEIKTIALINYCKRKLTPFKLELLHLQLSEIILNQKENFSVYEFLENYQNVLDCDINYPIIMGVNGTIVDGCHRIIKAIIEGKDTILCYKLPKSILELLTTGEILNPNENILD